MEGQVRIETCFAFVVVDDDGTEGVPAFMTPDGMFLPLMGADEARVESLMPVVQAMATDSGKEITLVRFKEREELGVIHPEPEAGGSSETVG